MSDYIFALALFIGTTIGAGIYGLPYVTAELGFIPTLVLFLLLGILVLVIQLLVGEIALRTYGAHRMPGYIEYYLGPKAKIISTISNTFGLFGAALAYIIIGGSFLSRLLMPYLGATEAIYVIVFFAAGAFLIFIGSKVITRSALFTLTIFFIILFFLFSQSLPYIKPEHFFSFNPAGALFAYGVILFSISGMSVIPETRDQLKNKEKKLFTIIILGTIIPIFAYIIFIVTVFGVTGTQTSSDALSGMQKYLGPQALTIGYILGILTTFTSYLSVGLTIKKIFWLDLKCTHFTAWVLASFIPILLYFSGFQNFIFVMGLTGALTMAIDGTMVFIMHYRAQKIAKRSPEYIIKLSLLTRGILIAIFLIGVVFTLITLRS